VRVGLSSVCECADVRIGLSSVCECADVHIGLSSVCEFRENWCREEFTHLVGINGVTFARVP
jgi:hypothetical protein